jgi:hypothetical protein
MALRIIIRRAGAPDAHAKCVPYNRETSFDEFASLALDELGADASTHYVAKIALLGGAGAPGGTIAPHFLSTVLRDHDQLEISIRAKGDNDDADSPAAPPRAAAPPAAADGAAAATPAARACKSVVRKPRAPPAAAAPAGCDSDDDADKKSKMPLRCFDMHTAGARTITVGEKLNGSVEEVKQQVAWLQQRGVKTIIALINVTRKECAATNARTDNEHQ